MKENARKNEEDLEERWKFGTSTTTMQCSLLHKKKFQIMIYLADMAFWMSNFDDFDHGQISWKLAQR